MYPDEKGSINTDIPQPRRTLASKHKQYADTQDNVMRVLFPDTASELIAEAREMYERRECTPYGRCLRIVREREQTN